MKLKINRPYRRNFGFGERQFERGEVVEFLEDFEKPARGRPKKEET